jgi:hypothetical protein
MELFKKSDEESEAFRQRLIKSVREKGYFEVDDEFHINREKANQLALEQWENTDLSGLRSFTVEEEAEMEANRCIPLVLDEEDAAVLDLLSSDSISNRRAKTRARHKNCWFAARGRKIGPPAGAANRAAL